MKNKRIKRGAGIQSIISPIILLFLLISSCNFSEKKQVNQEKQTSSSLPYLKETKGVKQLIVDDGPFVILGGELLNSSASSIEYMEPVWPKLKLLNVNTVFLPINWQQFEPVEGEFDYTLVDSHINSAHKNGLHIVFLWFGSWKNGQSHYTPDWVKTDLNRFSRMQHKGQKITNTISNINEECLKADKKAYVKLMERIARVDQYGTVLMMQIENEVGLLGGSRDFSPAATALFEQNVPTELINHLNQNIEKVKPAIRKAYQSNGSKTQGSWVDVFGESLLTDELFMAWNYATYINQLSKAGRQVHNIPTLVNTWAADRDQNPGDWPSGGPNYRMLDVWQAGAPDIDVLAIDNYSDSFDLKCNDFIHQGNPLFIPKHVLSG